MTDQTKNRMIYICRSTGCNSSQSDKIEEALKKE
jgi:hypothetical protein